MKEAGTTRPHFTAFALTDCHTCLSGNRKCGRQRPYCSSCLEKGVKCGGYVTPLSWHESRAYSGKASRRRQPQRHDRRIYLQSQQYRSHGRLDSSDTGSVGTSRHVRFRSRDSRSPAPLISPPTDYNAESSTISPEVTQNVIESDPANTQSLLDVFVTQASPEDHPDHDSIPGHSITSASVHSTQSWIGPQTEDDEISDYEEALPAVAQSTAVATSQSYSTALTPSNLMLGTDFTLPFEWSNMESESTQAMLDSLFSTFPLTPFLGWRQQHEMALKYCKPQSSLP